MLPLTLSDERVFARAKWFALTVSLVFLAVLLTIMAQYAPRPRVYSVEEMKELSLDGLATIIHNAQQV